MVTWKNMDTLASYQELQNSQRIDLAAVISGSDGAQRVKNYSIPMGEGLDFNYGTRPVDDSILEVLAKLAEEAQLIEKYAALGCDVQMTEMALRNFELEQADKHAELYGKLFQVFKRINAGDNKPLTCVAFWGIKDNPTPSDYSYRQNGPYCGLITENYEIKTSFDAVHAEMSK